MKISSATFLFFLSGIKGAHGLVTTLNCYEMVGSRKLYIKLYISDMQFSINILNSGITVSLNLHIKAS